MFNLIIKINMFKTEMKLERLKKYVQREPNDELYTPEDAVKIILKYIPKNVKTIREPTAFERADKIVQILEENWYKVITSHIQEWKDFFNYEPNDYDMIITNPPYSIKTEFLKRAYQLWKPFMFLLPTTTLEGKERTKLYSKYWIQLIIPNYRINFLKHKWKSSWFHTSWFCWNCWLDKDLNFII